MAPRTNGCAASADVMPSASRASTSSLRSRRSATIRRPTSTVDASELPTTIPDSGMSVRASSGKIRKPNSTPSVTVSAAT